MTRFARRMGTALVLLFLIAIPGQASRHHAVRKPPVPFAPAAQAWVLELNDLTAGATTPPLAGPAQGNEFTIELWAFGTEPGDPENTAAPYVNKTYPGEPGDAFRLFCRGGAESRELVFSWSTGAPGSAQSIEGGTIPYRVWTHVAVVYSQSTMRLYVNDEEVAHGTGKGPLPTAADLPMMVGDGYSGAMRQIRFWSRALTKEELRSAALGTVTGSEPGLVLAWPLDDGAGVTARALGSQPVPLSRNPTAHRWVRPSILETGPYFSKVWPEMVLPFELPIRLNRGRLIDFDSDGDLDVLICQSNITEAYDTPTVPLALRNDGTGHLTDATSDVFGSSPPKTDGVRDTAVADFTGDGRPDFFVGNFGPDAPGPEPGAQDQIFVQDASGHLIDETAARLPVRPHVTTHGLAVGDVDGDHDVDVVFGPGNPPPSAYLWRNDGQGHFTEELIGMGGATIGLLDAEGDGDLDLLVDVYDGPDGPERLDGARLTLNDGTGHFVYQPASVLPPTLFDGQLNDMRTGDLNADGFTDAIVKIAGPDSYADVRLQVYLSNHDGTFRDGSAQLPQGWYADELNHGGELELADFNGDGLTDMVIPYAGGTRLFLNKGNGAFVDVSEALPMFNIGFALPGDLDGDLDTDLVIFDGLGVGVLRNLKKLDAATVTEP